MSSREQLREALGPKLKKFETAIRTESGRLIVEILSDTFSNSSVFDSDPLKMARKVGQVELVEYLKGLRELGERDE